MNKRILLMASCTAMLSPFTTMTAHAENAFAGHYSISGEKFVDMLTSEQKQELQTYLNYEEREPCQNYQDVPDGFYRDNCMIKYIYPEPVKDEAVPAPQPKAQKVLNSYKVYFDFDKYDVTSEAMDVLNRIASEIKTYNPATVTVAGYTDRAGSDEYNYTLSKERADAVSQALTSRGVENRVINEKAYGETMPAVETKDGVRLPENRRVTVNFMK